jgi:LPLT family lysophospholipid transporter-like MFS transporter
MAGLPATTTLPDADTDAAASLAAASTAARAAANAPAGTAARAAAGVASAAAASARLPPGVPRLLLAQFLSALADNALLIVGIALLTTQGRPGWWAPLLKLSITLAYVLLAPAVGALADHGPKARLMAWMNGLKMLAVLALMAGLPPLLAFGVLGVAAAAYAPAKYGLLTELVPPALLVRANAWLEVTVVGAVLLGTVLGGLLVCAPVREHWGPWLLAAVGLAGAPPALAAMATVLLLHSLAGLLNLGLPDSGARYPATRWHLPTLSRELLQANRALWRDAQGGLSLAVTTVFWGVGALMQFAVLRWAVEVLALSLSQAACLQAAVAVGVVLGAALAGRRVALAAAPRVLPVGVALGLLLPLCAALHSVLLALPLLVAVGAAGGYLVVPMNALLQHRGARLLSAGRSIAVQNLNENASVLLALGAYTGLTALAVPVVPLMAGLGLLVAAVMALLLVRARVPLRPA